MSRPADVTRRLDAVVVPLTLGEIDLLPTALSAWSRHLSPACLALTGIDLVLIFNAEPDHQQFDEVIAALDRHPLLRDTFAATRIEHVGLSGDTDRYSFDYEGVPLDQLDRPPGGWKAGPNNMFRFMVRRCRDYDVVLQMELDCHPLVTGWLARCADAVGRFPVDTWIRGSTYHGSQDLSAEAWAGHINGNAFYATGSPAFQQYITRAFEPWADRHLESVDPRLAYDQLLELHVLAEPDPDRRADLRHRMATTPLIVNYGGVEDRETLTELRRRHPDAVLAHGRRLTPDEPKTGAAGQRRTTSAGEPDAEARSALPRVLLLEPESIGSPSPLGQYFAGLFANWSPDRFMQLAVASGRCLPVTLDGTADPPLDLADAMHRVRAFEPDVIVFRPDGNARPLVDVVDMAGGEIPVVTAVLDLWPDRLATVDPAGALTMGTALEEWIARAAQRMCITDSMAAHLAERTGLSFVTVGNLVDLSRWPSDAPADDSPVTFELSSRLAGNKAGGTAALVALAMSARRDDRALLNIRTSLHADEHRWTDALSGLEHVSVGAYTPTYREFQERLNTCDVVVIAFDFSATSERYLRHSFANRIAEAHAAGRAILAVGPSSLASMHHLEASGAAVCVHRPDLNAIGEAIDRLVDDHQLRARLAHRSELAAPAFDAPRIRASFETLLTDAAAAVGEPPVPRESFADARSDLTSLRNTATVRTWIIPDELPANVQNALNTEPDTTVVCGRVTALRALAHRPSIYLASADPELLLQRRDDLVAATREVPTATFLLPDTVVADGAAVAVDPPPGAITFPHLDFAVGAVADRTLNLRAERGVIRYGLPIVTLLQIAGHLGARDIVVAAPQRRLDLSPDQHRYLTLAKTIFDGHDIEITIAVADANQTTGLEGIFSHRRVEDLVGDQIDPSTGAP